jgi:arylsulfatase A-like enzyme
MAEHAEWRQRLEAWRDKNVQNLDVLPTIRDILEIEDDPKSAVVNLPGRSLVAQGPSGQDLIMGQSTCGFRQWALDGFYLVNGKVKVIVSNDQATPQIYDLQSDPLEERNLWGDPAWKSRVMPWLEAAVKTGQERKAACERVKAVCPVK